MTRRGKMNRLNCWSTRNEASSGCGSTYGTTRPESRSTAQAAIIGSAFSDSEVDSIHKLIGSPRHELAVFRGDTSVYAEPPTLS
jgi:hypothetical protein